MECWRGCWKGCKRGLKRGEWLVERRGGLWVGWMVRCWGVLMVELMVELLGVGMDGMKDEGMVVLMGVRRVVGMGLMRVEWMDGWLDR